MVDAVKPIPTFEDYAPMEDVRKLSLNPAIDRLNTLVTDLEALKPEVAKSYNACEVDATNKKIKFKHGETLREECDLSGMFVGISESGIAISDGTSSEYPAINKVVFAGAKVVQDSTDEHKATITVGVEADSFVGMVSPNCDLSVTSVEEGDSKKVQFKVKPDRAKDIVDTALIGGDDGLLDTTGILQWSSQSDPSGNRKIKATLKPEEHAKTIKEIVSTNSDVVASIEGTGSNTKVKLSYKNAPISGGSFVSGVSEDGTSIPKFMANEIDFRGEGVFIRKDESDPSNVKVEVDVDRLRLKDEDPASPSELPIKYIKKKPGMSINTSTGELDIDLSREYFVGFFDKISDVPSGTYFVNKSYAYILTAENPSAGAMRKSPQLWYYANKKDGTQGWVPDFVKGSIIGSVGAISNKTVTQIRVTGGTSTVDDNGLLTLNIKDLLVKAEDDESLETTYPAVTHSGVLAYVKQHTFSKNLPPTSSVMISDGVSWNPIAMKSLPNSQTTMPNRWSGDLVGGLISDNPRYVRPLSNDTTKGEYNPVTEEFTNYKFVKNSTTPAFNPPSSTDIDGYILRTFVHQPGTNKPTAETPASGSSWVQIAYGLNSGKMWKRIKNKSEDKRKDWEEVGAGASAELSISGHNFDGTVQNPFKVSEVNFGKSFITVDDSGRALIELRHEGAMLGVFEGKDQLLAAAKLHKQDWAAGKVVGYTRVKDAHVTGAPIYMFKLWVWQGHEVNPTDTQIEDLSKWEVTQTPANGYNTVQLGTNTQYPNWYPGEPSSYPANRRLGQIIFFRGNTSQPAYSKGFYYSDGEHWRSAIMDGTGLITIATDDKKPDGSTQDPIENISNVKFDGTGGTNITLEKEGKPGSTIGKVTIHSKFGIDIQANDKDNPTHAKDVSDVANFVFHKTLISEEVSEEGKKTVHVYPSPTKIITPDQSVTDAVPVDAVQFQNTGASVDIVEADTYKIARVTLPTGGSSQIDADSFVALMDENTQVKATKVGAKVSLALDRDKHIENLQAWEDTAASDVIIGESGDQPGSKKLKLTLNSTKLAQAVHSALDNSDNSEVKSAVLGTGELQLKLNDDKLRDTTQRHLFSGDLTHHVPVLKAGKGLSITEHQDAGKDKQIKLEVTGDCTLSFLGFFDSWSTLVQAATEGSNIDNLKYGVTHGYVRHKPLGYNESDPHPKLAAQYQIYRWNLNKENPTLGNVTDINNWDSRQWLSCDGYGITLVGFGTRYPSWTPSSTNQEPLASVHKGQFVWDVVTKKWYSSDGTNWIEHAIGNPNHFLGFFNQVSELEAIPTNTLTANKSYAYVLSARNPFGDAEPREIPQLYLYAQGGSGAPAWKHHYVKGALIGSWGTAESDRNQAFDSIVFENGKVEYDGGSRKLTVDMAGGVTAPSVMKVLEAGVNIGLSTNETGDKIVISSVGTGANAAFLGIHNTLQELKAAGDAAGVSPNESYGYVLTAAGESEGGHPPKVIPQMWIYQSSDDYGMPPNWYPHHVKGAIVVKTETASIDDRAIECFNFKGDVSKVKEHPNKYLEFTIPHTMESYFAGYVSDLDELASLLHTQYGGSYKVGQITAMMPTPDTTKGSSFDFYSWKDGTMPNPTLDQLKNRLSWEVTTLVGNLDISAADIVRLTDEDGSDLVTANNNGKVAYVLKDDNVIQSIVDNVDPDGDLDITKTGDVGQGKIKAVVKKDKLSSSLYTTGVAGDILKAGSNITLTKEGNQIKIDSSGGGKPLTPADFVGMVENTTAKIKAAVSGDKVKFSSDKFVDGTLVETSGWLEHDTFDEGNNTLTLKVEPGHEELEERIEAGTNVTFSKGSSITGETGKYKLKINSKVSASGNGISSESPVEGVVIGDNLTGSIVDNKLNLKGEDILAVDSAGATHVGKVRRLKQGRNVNFAKEEPSGDIPETIVINADATLMVSGNGIGTTETDPTQPMIGLKIGDNLIGSLSDGTVTLKATGSGTTPVSPWSLSGFKADGSATSVANVTAMQLGKEFKMDGSDGVAVVALRHEGAMLGIFPSSSDLFKAALNHKQDFVKGKLLGYVTGSDSTAPDKVVSYQVYVWKSENANPSDDEIKDPRSWDYSTYIPSLGFCTVQTGYNSKYPTWAPDTPIGLAAANYKGQIIYYRGRDASGSGKGFYYSDGLSWKVAKLGGSSITGQNTSGVAQDITGIILGDNLTGSFAGGKMTINSTGGGGAGDSKITVVGSDGSKPVSQETKKLEFKDLKTEVITESGGSYVRVSGMSIQGVDENDDEIDSTTPVLEFDTDRVALEETKDASHNVTKITVSPLGLRVDGHNDSGAAISTITDCYDLTYSEDFSVTQGTISTGSKKATVKSRGIEGINATGISLGRANKIKAGNNVTMTLDSDKFVISSKTVGIDVYKEDGTKFNDEKAIKFKDCVVERDTTQTPALLTITPKIVDADKLKAIITDGKRITTSVVGDKLKIDSNHISVIGNNAAGTETTKADADRIKFGSDLTMSGGASEAVIDWKGFTVSKDEVRNEGIKNIKFEGGVTVAKAGAVATVTVTGGSSVLKVKGKDSSNPNLDKEVPDVAEIDFGKYGLLTQAGNNVSVVPRLDGGIKVGTSSANFLPFKKIQVNGDSKSAIQESDGGMLVIDSVRPVKSVNSPSDLGSIQDETHENRIALTSNNDTLHFLKTETTTGGGKTHKWLSFAFAGMDKLVQSLVRRFPEKLAAAASPYSESSSKTLGYSTVKGEDGTETGDKLELPIPQKVILKNMYVESKSGEDPTWIQEAYGLETGHEFTRYQYKDAATSAIAWSAWKTKATVDEACYSVLVCDADVHFSDFSTGKFDKIPMIVYQDPMANLIPIITGDNPQGKFKVRRPGVYDISIISHFTWEKGPSADLSAIENAGLYIYEGNTKIKQSSIPNFFVYNSSDQSKSKFHPITAEFKGVELELGKTYHFGVAITSGASAAETQTIRLDPYRNIVAIDPANSVTRTAKHIQNTLFRTMGDISGQLGYAVRTQAPSSGVVPRIFGENHLTEIKTGTNS